MKRIASIKTVAAVIALVTILVHTPAMALWNPLKPKTGLSVTINAPYLDIRTGPGRGYPIFHVAERNEVVRLYKRKTDWYKLETATGEIGWAHRDDLTGSITEEGVQANFSIEGKQAYIDRRWEFGVAGGDFSGARALTMYAGYHFTPNISTELKLTEAFGEFSNIKLVSINMVHQPFPQWYVSPFFTLGTGVMRISPNAGLVLTQERDDPALTVGGGVFIYASRNFLVRLEHNNHTVLTDRSDNEEVNEWKAGFSVFF